MAPLATTRPAPEEDELPDPLAEAELAGAVAVAAGVAVAIAFTPPVTGPLSGTVVSELPIAMAALWNAANVLPVAGALIDPTIPIPQWRTCLQKYQIGAASFVMLMENCFAACKPESKPAELLPLAARYVQGFEKEDCVTE